MHIDYYFAAQSPWAYLGHARFAALAKTHGATVRVLPADFGRIFAASGGLPLPKRAPQRQAYRLVDLRRNADAVGLPLNLHPKFFPVSADAAACHIIAADQVGGTQAAMELSGRLFAAVWAQERDIANASTLAALWAESGLPPASAAAAATQAVQSAYESITQQAIDAGVFGAPSYVINGEIFWGQDRLDLVERKLRA